MCSCPGKLWCRHTKSSQVDGLIFYECSFILHPNIPPKSTNNMGKTCSFLMEPGKHGGTATCEHLPTAPLTSQTIQRFNLLYLLPDSQINAGLFIQSIISVLFQCKNQKKSSEAQQTGVSIV